jgi:hypothetical protein
VCVVVFKPKPKPFGEAICHARSSFNPNARAMVQLMEATSIECVRRVRKWSPVPFRKTCVYVPFVETRANE